MTAAEKTNFIINEILPYVGLYFLVVFIIGMTVQGIFRYVFKSDEVFERRKAELEKRLKYEPINVDLMIEYDNYQTLPSYEYGLNAAGVLGRTWIVTSGLIWLILFYTMGLDVANVIGGSFAAAGLGGQFGVYLKKKAGLL